MLVARLAEFRPTRVAIESSRVSNYWNDRYADLRIYTNLVAIAGPGERIVLLIGAGHAHVLNGLAAADPRFCLVPASDFLVNE